MSVPAIILAAGASSRLGRPKQLLQYRGEFLLPRAIRLAAEAGANPVLAVLGAHLDVILASLQFDLAIPVVNKAWQQGIAGSIHAGLRAIDAAAPAATGALIMTCDQLQLTADHLRALLHSFSAQTSPAIACSAYAGIHGIPAIFPRSAFPNLWALGGDKGARALLAKPPCPLIAHKFPGGEIDIDLPTDLVHLE